MKMNTHGWLFATMAVISTVSVASSVLCLSGRHDVSELRVVDDAGNVRIRLGEVDSRGWAEGPLYGLQILDAEGRTAVYASEAGVLGVGSLAGDHRKSRVEVLANGQFIIARDSEGRQRLRVSIPEQFGADGEKQSYPVVELFNASGRKSLDIGLTHDTNGGYVRCWAEEGSITLGEDRPGELGVVRLKDGKLDAEW